MSTDRPTIVDLFCGAGGFGLGAELAGFHTAAAVDIDPNLQSAYRLNFPGTRVLKADVSTMDAAAWSFALSGARPDGVIGGPPCQGFSRIGRRQKGDPRNSLVRHFFRQVDILKPRFFIMENVEGILDEVNRPMLNAGLSLVSKRYTVLGPTVIDASTFGAPTTRRRVVVVGYDASMMSAVEPSIFQGGAMKVLVRDAISDLPAPIQSKDDSQDFGWSRYPTVASDAPNLSEYAKSMRRLPPPGMGWTASLERLAHGAVSGQFSTRHSAAVQERFASTIPGETEPVSRYPRLKWDGLCPTLRAGTGPERGSFQAMRPIHPAESRVITVREAARLQGFPDWFVFSPAKWHSFRMIGNSVSPIVSQALLDALRQRLNESPLDHRKMG